MSVFKQLVPELRFFDYKGDFNSFKIQQLFDRVSNPVIVDKNKSYQQIGIRSHGKGIFHKPFVTGEELGNKRVFWVKEDAFVVNIVFAWEQAVAKTSVTEKGMIASHRFPMYAPKNNITDLDYIHYFFLTKKGKYLLGLASPGGAGRNKTLGQKTFAELNIVIPTLSEQQKIASFLSAVDKKVEKLTRKRELLQVYKKGVMQKIFSQQIRFKDDDGKEFSDWEEKRLEDVITFIPTNSLSRNYLNYDTGEIKNIHYGDIHTKFKMCFDIKNEVVPYINNTVNIKKINNDQYCRVGDIVIADASEDYADIGKTIEICNLANEKIVSGLHTFLGRDITDEVVNGFKGYLLQSKLLRKQIQIIAQGVSVLGISKKNMLNIIFYLPFFDEQKKIVKLLKNIDKKIDSVQSQITKTKTFKKGLLQKMFV